MVKHLAKYLAEENVLRISEGEYTQVSFDVEAK